MKIFKSESLKIALLFITGFLFLGIAIESHNAIFGAFGSSLSVISILWFILINIIEH